MVAPGECHGLRVRLPVDRVAALMSAVQEERRTSSAQEGCCKKRIAGGGNRKASPVGVLQVAVLAPVPWRVPCHRLLPTGETGETDEAGPQPPPKNLVGTSVTRIDRSGDRPGHMLITVAVLAVVLLTAQQVQAGTLIPAPAAPTAPCRRTPDQVRPPARRSHTRAAFGTGKAAGRPAEATAVLLVVAVLVVLVT